MSEVRSEQDDIEAERVAFEKWTAEEGLELRRNRAQYGSPGQLGRYADSDTYWAWEAWRGRASR